MGWNRRLARNWSRFLIVYLGIHRGAAVYPVEADALNHRLTNPISVNAAQTMSASLRKRPNAALPRIDAMCQEATYAAQQPAPF
jgi:hypothetical protein